MKKKILAVLVTMAPLYGFTQNDIPIQNYLKGEYSVALDGLTALASANNPEAAFDLGQMYLQGWGVQKDTEKGTQLIQQAAAKNYVPAQLYLAKNILMEKNDTDAALIWFQKAADLGNAEAQMVCATSYLYGYGVPQNTEKARKCLIKAAQNGEPLAQYELAKMFLDNKKGKDFKLAYMWLMKSADQGEVKAQSLLGLMLLTGTKFSQDETKGVELLKKAAQQQDKNAGLALVNYYLSLPSSPENLKESLYWLNQLSQTEIPQISVANANIGKVPFLLPKNVAPTTLTEWLSLAKQGDINAAQQVGFLYSHDNWTAENQEKAVQWLTTAAAHNDYIAKIQLEGVQAQWKNQHKLQDGTVLTPKLVQINKSQIFDKNYQLTNPSSLSAQDIIEALGRLNYDQEKIKIDIAHYQQTLKPMSSGEAKEIIRQSDYGYPQGQFQLGLMYQLGIGVKKNIEEAVKYYQLAATQNNAKAQYALALLALTGKGIDKDYKEAEDWLTKSALSGNVDAQYLLGQLYEFGYGESDSKNYIAKDLVAAKTMYGLAATNDSTKAQYSLAQLYISGLLSQKNAQDQMKNFQMAYALFKQASATIPEAKLDLAFFYLNAKQLQENQQWAFTVANDQISANKENAQEKTLLTFLREHGMDSTQNKNEILTLYKQLADAREPIFTKQGYKSDQQWAFAIANKESFSTKENETAKLLLALMYDRGIGTPENKNEALVLYKQLAEAGEPIALYIMGSKYGLGDGVKKSETLARDYLRKAAASDLGFANYNLAVLNYQQNDLNNFLDLLNIAKSQGYQSADILIADYYLTHDGDADEKEKAVRTYQNLANAGNVTAQIKLAYMYQNGIYFPVNYQTAFTWYQKAADNNNALAQYALGEMYQLGQGIDRDLALAISWYKKAAAQNFTPAQVALGFINEVDQKDYSQARLWYQLAAKNGKSPIAEYNLGLLYEYGKGTVADLEAAKTLYQQAASKGFQAAATALQGLTQNHDN